MLEYPIMTKIEISPVGLSLNEVLGRIADELGLRGEDREIYIRSVSGGSGVLIKAGKAEQINTSLGAEPKDDSQE